MKNEPLSKYWVLAPLIILMGTAPACGNDDDDTEPGDSETETSTDSDTSTDTDSDTSEGAVCGGFIGAKCDEGYFCEFPMGSCKVMDLEGECVEIPEACPDVYLPVCGCDGVTYGNDCEAQAAKESLDYEGACR